VLADLLRGCLRAARADSRPRRWYGTTIGDRGPGARLGSASGVRVMSSTTAGMAVAPRRSRLGHDTVEDVHEAGQPPLPLARPGHQPDRALAWTAGCGRLRARNATQRHTWTTSVARRLRKFGDGQQDGRVFDCMQRVPRLGNDQEVAVASFPLGGVSNEPHPSSQHLEGRLAGILVF
jgi:hypothetical protein